MNGFNKRISRISGAALLMSLCAAHVAAAVDLNEQIEFNIPSGRLSDALIEFSKQAHVQVLTSGERAAHATTEGVSGTQTLQDALMRLLDSSGLEFQVMSESAIAVREAAPKRPTSGGANLGPGEASFRVAQADVTDPSASPEGKKQELPDVQRLELEEILVTGSHIRGAEPTSQVITITQQEMRLSGHNNLGEVIRALPQNFSGGQNPGVALGADAQPSNLNLTGASAPNLRGLGPDATLTLFNGTRLPYDGSRQAMDVSVIPVSAIDRVEVLLDGASAIYGSDAVGGVVNVILKPDYEGAELSVRVGTATDGGYDQTQYTALAGHNWGSGGFLVAGDLSRSDPVLASQRDYLNYLSVPSTTLYPGSDQKSALLSGHQDLAGFAELALDAFYTRRHSEPQLLSEPLRINQEQDSTIWGVAPALNFSLPRDWSLRVHGFAGRDEAEIDQRLFIAASGTQIRHSATNDFNDSEAAGVETEGPLFTLPGGEARFSTGGGWRKNTYERTDPLTGVSSLAGTSRNYYGYGELNLPLASESQNIPWVRRLSLNGAVRYDHYNLFGDSTTPKVGMIWSPARGFDIKASWGRSFKVPTLSQQFSSPQLTLARASLYGAPAGETVVVRGGGNPDLGPERAEVVTAGFVVEPKFLPGSRFEFNWFDIDYTDRVVSPLAGGVASQALVDPTVADFVTLNPTVQQLDAVFAAAGLPVGTFTTNQGNPNFTPRPYDPAEVYAILDTRNTNATTNRMRGIDLSATYAVDLFRGVMALSANGDWILDAQRQLRSLAPEQETSGLVFWPAEFKGRLGASWSRNGFSISTIVSYIGGVTNNQVTPNAEGDSMTTLDLVFDHQIDSDLLGDVAYNIALTNVFNERPPFMQPRQSFYVNYDSTNYSALGRVVSVTVTKRF